MSPRMSAHRGLKPREKTRSVPVDPQEHGISGPGKPLPCSRCPRLTHRAPPEYLADFHAPPNAGYRPDHSTDTANNEPQASGMSIAPCGEVRHNTLFVSAGPSEKIVDNMNAAASANANHLDGLTMTMWPTPWPRLTVPDSLTRPCAGRTSIIGRQVYLPGPGRLSASSGVCTRSPGSPAARIHGDGNAGAAL